jgi:hypothetical protein
MLAKQILSISHSLHFECPITPRPSLTHYYHILPHHELQGFNTQDTHNTTSPYQHVYTSEPGNDHLLSPTHLHSPHPRARNIPSLAAPAPTSRPPRLALELPILRARAPAPVSRHPRRHRRRRNGHTDSTDTTSPCLRTRAAETVVARVVLGQDGYGAGDRGVVLGVGCFGGGGED